MKKPAILLAFLLLLSVLSATVFASEGGENYGSLYLTDTEMKLDGNFDEIYSGGIVIPINQTHTGEPVDEYARAYLVWQEGDAAHDYLWCFVAVNDTMYTVSDPEFYNRDSVELFLNYLNSDSDADTYQHIVDAAGDCKEYSYPNNRNEVVPGECDKVIPVSIGGELFFEACTRQVTSAYCVEYRVPTPKLEEGQKIAFSMTIHDATAGWYFCESSLAPANWVPASYDYFTVSRGKAEVNADRVWKDDAETLAHETEFRPGNETKAPMKPAETKTAESEAPAGTKAPAAEEPKSFPGWAIGVVIAVVLAGAVTLGFVIGKKK